MKATEVKRFAILYERYLNLFILQGKSDSTIDTYSRAASGQNHPDILTPTEIERILWATKKICYRVFLLTTSSMEVTS